MRAQIWNHREECYELVPAAPLYVLSNDKFVSGWGRAKGKINTVVVPCETREQAESVAAYARYRNDQKYVRIVTNPPKEKAHVIYSMCLGWIDRAKDLAKV